ncbi:hypothetical protein [Alkalibacillus haloalkaliphilus]|uniref:hypothetical protein n=1 Tax=Alkalibacillus haloalkaliphilus TaxID=94136 RepID=UPI00293549BB|nr:hypothetical protein [Alkalibacillus haloalkaliphilus]MDV2582171.1 hypothetical protein [Alkalibacillus haloalkaliphilus]
MKKEVESISKEQYSYSVIKAAINLPGVKINREEFLRAQLKNYVKPEVVEEAIKSNPANAGIPTKTIDQIAHSVIKAETTRVTSISAAAGLPGGIAMMGTVPADVAQYFGHIIRVLQKQVYLYGWGEMYSSDESLDDETLNQLTLFLGVMFGVNAANSAISQLVKVAAPKVEKDLSSRALTNGVVFPIVKKVATKLGYKMTKQVFARGVSKIVPVVGAVASGTITYTTFKPLTSRLQKYLKSLPIADPNFYNQSNQFSYEEKDIIDVDYVEEEEDTIKL